MKKIIALVLVGLFLVSCGPRRLGCGPNRCEVKSTKVNSEVNKSKFS